MAAILAAHGISPDRLVLDEESRDTLQNVVAAARFILARKLDGALLCTDHYHAPRVRMLFAGLGISSANMPSALGRGEIPWRHLIYMSAREVIAYIYDFLIIRLRVGERMQIYPPDKFPQPKLKIRLYRDCETVDFQGAR